MLFIYLNFVGVSSCNRKLGSYSVYYIAGMIVITFFLYEAIVGKCIYGTWWFVLRIQTKRNTKRKREVEYVPIEPNLYLPRCFLSDL